MRTPLIGRITELNQLAKQRGKGAASLVVLSGRRRIGKSSLVQEYGRSFAKFCQFQGLAPRPGIRMQDQLNAFADQFDTTFSAKKSHFKNWFDALKALAKEVQKGDVLVLLDELSWLATADPDFAGKLKILWDTEFKKNPRLVMVLCGSVSTWIERNVLSDSGFVGRISLVIRLGELPLSVVGKFWGNRSGRVSNFEKLRFLAVAGGVPKYLEELKPTDSTDSNIKRLCFTSGGYLFEDFNRIFSDIFGKRSEAYRRIVELLVVRRLTAQEIGQKLGSGLSRQLSEYLWDLTMSGFIQRDTRSKLDRPDSQRGSQYRVADNYLRFYLRYVHKNRSAIEAGLFSFAHLDGLIGWDSLLGLQFENLILNRLPEVITALELSNERINFAGPIRQSKTVRQEGVEIDLLLACRSNTYYLCEIKFRRYIDEYVIREVAEKITRLKLPKRASVRPVLIYAGDLDPAIGAADYFDKILNVERLLEGEQR